MEKSKEELAADLVWRYVEHVRETDGEEALTPAELRALTEVLSTAAALPTALEDVPCEAREAAVRERVLKQVRAAMPASSSPPMERVAAVPTMVPPPPPLLQLRNPWVARCAMATALACALAIAVFTVPIWHRPPVVVRTRSVPRDVPDVRPMSEQRAHELISLAVRHEEIDRQEERDLLWHMLVCPGCFDEYVRLRSYPEVAVR